LATDLYLIGCFLDNEMKWGPDHRGGHLFDQFFAEPLESNASKAALIQFLQDRYKTIEALKVDFSTQATSWKEIGQLKRLTARGTPGAQKARSAWAGEVAKVFFSTTNEALRAVDPNHLNLGARFISQLVPRPVIAEAGKHVDVMSINFYDLAGPLENFVHLLSSDYLPITDFLAEHYKVGGRPILISEWGYRAADAGLPNTWPPIYPTLPTQAARADAYETYFRNVLAKPWFVGQHWFLFADQPAEGRFDGENNNFGLVSEQDKPYKPLVDRSARMYQEIYRRLP
jgi:agarase